MCENLAVHLVHKLTADIKSQTAAFLTFGICASPEAFKDVRQISIGKCTAAIFHSDKNTSILLGEVYGNFLAVTVFYSVFDYILYNFNASVKVAAYKAIAVSRKSWDIREQ